MSALSVEEAVDLIAKTLPNMGLEFERTKTGSFAIVLPGERKLSTTCILTVGTHALTINAFVIRHPDENVEQVHRWLLERNIRMYGVAFASDDLGDIYLVGRVPLHAITEAELDRVLGAVLEYSDSSFDPLLEMGFASAIRREWAWRVSRGESLENLSAFAHLVDE